MMALVPLPALSLTGRERRRRKVAKPVSKAARLAAIAQASNASRDACEVRRAYTSALAERLNLESDSFTRPGALARALRRRGVSPDLALESELFLRQLDEAAFAESGSLAADAAQRASQLYRKVDGDALPRSQIAVRAFAIVGLIAVSVATAHAYDTTAARRAFDQGVAAYEHHDFVTAREAFIAAVARIRPRRTRGPILERRRGRSPIPREASPRGSARFASSRSRPTCANASNSCTRFRGRLRATCRRSRRRGCSILRRCSGSARGDSPRTYASRNRPLGNRTVTTLAVVAALMAIGGFALNERLSGKHLAVMRHTASLSTDPQLGGERGATAIIGEVVRVTGRQGAWSRVRLDDGRDGWIDSAVLVSLDTRDAEQIRAN